LEALQTGKRHNSKRAAEMPGCGRRGKPKPGFPSPPTSPWKSLSRFPHSRSPGHDRHGKVEIQKQDSHFPTASSLSNKSKTKGDQPQPETLSFRLISGLEYALVAFFPSDHHYSSCSAFRESVESGLRLIEEYPHSVLVFGAEARYPEVEYGWIQRGRVLVDSPTHPLYRVAHFWEKPALRRAEALQKRGCLWNTFVTIGSAGAFLELTQWVENRANELLRPAVKTV
jgi:hypothetical protein